MRLTVCVFTIIAAICIGAQSASAAARANARDSLEILPPDEQYLHVYKTRDCMPAEVLTGTIEEELGGRWQISVWDQYSNTPRQVQGSGIDLAPSGIESAEQVEELALEFVADHANLFGGASTENLRTYRVSHVLGKWSVLFQQTHEDVPVLDSMIRLVITDSGRLYAFGAVYYPEIDTGARPTIDLSEATAIARAAAPFDTSASRLIRDPMTVVLPVLDTSVEPAVMEFHLAHRVDVPTRAPYGLYATYVDATSGAILRRNNSVRHSYDGTVTGDVEFPNPCDGLAESPLAHLELGIDASFVVTGDDGDFTLASGSGPLPYNASLTGPYAEVHCVPRTNDLGQHASIAVDPSTNVVHIAFQDFTNRDLMHAVKSGGRWALETVDMRGDVQGSNGEVGYYNSIALQSGVPYVAHFQDDGGSSGKLRYAARQGGTWIWTKMTITDGSDTWYGLNASLKVVSGKARIAYQDANSTLSSTRLRFAYEGTSSWTIETADASGSGAFCALAMSSADRPYIAYRDLVNSDLKFTYRIRPIGESSGWATPSVADASGDIGEAASMALDGSVLPHISYYDNTNHDLKYAYRPTSSTWNRQTLDSGGDVGKFTSIARGSNATLHIAYYDVTNADLKYITHNGTAWQTAVTVDAPGNVGQYCSIALDSDNKPHIAYYAAGSELDLKHAWYDGSTWTKESVNCQDDTLSGTITSGTPVTIDFGGDATNRAALNAFFTVNTARAFYSEIDPVHWVVPDSVPKATVYVDIDAATAPGGEWEPPFTMLFKGPGEAGTDEEGTLFSAGRVASYVGHEYGHGVDHWLTNEDPSSTYGMSEGQADISATFVTGRASGPGRSEDCELIVCDSDDNCGCDNTLVFPGDVIGQDEYLGAHVICGFNWDLRQHIESNADADSAKRHTARLWMGTLKQFGYSGYTMPEQVADYWLLDDDNGDLEDDVPHGLEIQQAAAEHGFYGSVIWNNDLIWASEDVAGNLNVASSTIAMDRDWKGMPHIAYLEDDVLGPEYVYTSRDCGAWSVTVLDAASGGASIDIGVPSNGLAVVAYAKREEEEAEVWFADKAVGWEPERIATRQASFPGGVVLAVDASDGVNVAFGTAPDCSNCLAVPDVRFARKSGGSWSVAAEPIDQGGTPAIAIAPSGLIGVCYLRGNDVRLASSTDNGATWDIETVVTEVTTGNKQPALVYDASSVAHICYCADDTLRYLYGPSWGQESVDGAPGSAMRRGAYSSIKIGADGYPRISYYDVYPGDVRYARKHGLGWTIDAADRIQDVGQSGSLELTWADEPMIAYLQKSTGALKLAAGGESKVPNAVKSSLCFDVEQSTGFAPENENPVVRLCPAGDYDALTVEFTLRDVEGAPLNGLGLSLVELSSSANLLGGGPSGSSNGSGYGELTLSAGSGNGRVGLCVDGLVLAQFELRSPDVSGAGVSSGYCALPTSTSYVDSFDCVNEACGFDAMGGPVSTGINQCWDLNGDSYVDTFDTEGWLEGESFVGGVAQHAGHSGVLGAENSCSGTGKAFAGVPGEPVESGASSEEQSRQAVSAKLLASLKRDFAVVPNPSRGNVLVAWLAPSGMRGEAEIYDVTGRRIRAIEFKQQGAGLRLVEWDGTGVDGLKVGSGIYFARLTFSGGSRVEKFTLLR